MSELSAVEQILMEKPKYQISLGDLPRQVITHGNGWYFKLTEATSGAGDSGRGRCQRCTPKGRKMVGKGRMGKKHINARVGVNALKKS